MTKKGNPENARKINTSLILIKLKEQGQISRAELARSLKLSKMTISSIVADLLEAGLVIEIGEGDSMKQGGRKPILLTLPEKSKFVLGIDVGLTNTAVAIGNLRGEFVYKLRVPTRRNHSQSSILEQIKELSASVIDESKVDRESILGVGLSIGGMVNKEVGYITESPDFNWRDVPLKTQLEDALKLPVVIDNCSRVMALGEKWYGKARGVDNFFFVNVGFGIGSAIVINNKIYEKNSEFGHIFITKKNVRCACGKIGCLESVSSGHAIERVANQILPERNGDWYSAREVAELAAADNSDAARIFQEAGKYLGRALAIVATLFNPDKVVIGGGVANSGELLLEPLMEEFRLHCMDIIRDSTKVELSGLGMDAGIVGAVSLALDQYVFHSERL